MSPVDLSVSAAPQVVCAWCRTVMRPGPAGRVSHGICHPCAAAMRNDLALLDADNPPQPLHAAVPVAPNLN